MGMQRDSYVLNDNEGTLSCGGGFNVTALDSAKIGVMLSNKGQFNNAQILTKESVENIMAGGDKKAFGEYSKGEFSSYKDQFWIRGNKNKAFSAIGIHGQWIYVDPTEKVVIIKQSSFPIADSSEIESYTIAGFNAIINKLSK